MYVRRNLKKKGIKLYLIPDFYKYIKIFNFTLNI